MNSITSNSASKYFTFALLALFLSLPATSVTAQELIQAPKNLVQYKLSKIRLEKSIYGDVIAVDYKRTREGSGSAHLVARTDDGRLGIMGLTSIEASGTIRLRKQFAALDRIMGGQKGIEIYFVSGGYGSEMYSPFGVGRKEKEYLVSNVIRYGNMTTTVTARALTKKEKENIEKARRESLPPETVPDGYQRSTNQTKLVPGADVLVGYRGEWQPAIVVSLEQRNRVKVLRERMEYCQTVSMDRWLAISNVTSEKIKNDPDFFKPMVRVLNGGNLVLEDDVQPLTDAMSLLKGTPLLQDEYSRWKDVYFLSSDNVKVRVLDKSFNRNKIAFVPIEKLAIRDQTIKDQDKESAKTSFAANVAGYENKIAGLSGSPAKGGSFPTSSAKMTPSSGGTLASSNDPSEFPTSLSSKSAQDDPVATIQEKKPTRTWKDSKGKYEIKARFVRADGPEIFLEREDGREFKITLAKLSKDDQQYVEQIKKEALKEDNPFKMVESGSVASTDPPAKPTKLSTGGSTPDYGLPLKNAFKFDDLGWGPECVAISPDDQYMIIGRNGNEVSFCDLKKRQVIRNSGRMDHMGDVTAATFTPDGKRLIICGDKGVVEIYTIGTGGELKMETQFSPHTKEIRSIAISEDSKYALTGSADNEARYWDIETGRQLVTLSGFSGKVKATCIRSTDNVLLATDGETLQVYGVAEKKLLQNQKITNSAYSQAAAFSPNGLILATDDSYDIRMWNLVTMQEMPKMKGNATSWSLVFAPDSRHLITGNRASISLWDAKKGQRVLSHSVGSSSYVKALCTNAKGTIFACSSGFKEVTVVEAQTTD